MDIITQKVDGGKKGRSGTITCLCTCQLQ